MTKGVRRLVFSAHAWLGPEAPNGSFGDREIHVDGGPHNCVGRVKATMRQAVPHFGDVFPRNFRFGRQNVGAYPLDRLTEFDEAEADGEHEPVVE